MKEKIRVAYIFETSLKNGGNFQTELSTASRLKKLNIENVEFEFFSNNKKNLETLKKYDFNICYFKKKYINIIIIQFYNFLTNAFLKKLVNFIFKLDSFEKFLISKSVDLVHFNSMSPLALSLKKIDYGVSFWDMGHIDNNAFPESKDNYYSLSTRDFIYQSLADHSLYVITDCIENKENFNFRYRIVNDKTHVIYSEPSLQLLNNLNKFTLSKKDIIKKYEIITEEYIFYPAQYWAHKNHIYILEALNILNHKYNKKITAVFCGADKNNLAYLKSTTEILKISDYVKFLDFVNEVDIVNFYISSFAIVVPTYFGPTNHPPIEGFFYQKPIFYSDLFSDNEQVRDAVVKIDLKDPKNLAQSLNDFLENSALLNKYKSKSIEKYTNLNQKLAKNEDILKKIFEKYKSLRKTYK